MNRFFIFKINEMLTTSQIDKGIIGGENGVIDTSKFALKNETATKKELQTLTETVANKLDASPIHHHDIAEVDLLQQSLNDKLDRTQRYGYTTILSDSEKINYLEKVETHELVINKEKNEKGYSVKVDDNGDILLQLGGVVIARYVSVSHEWVFSNVNINEVLENHRDAIEAIQTYIESGGNSEGGGDVDFNLEMIELINKNKNDITELSKMNQ